MSIPAKPWTVDKNVTEQAKVVETPEEQEASNSAANKVSPSSKKVDSQHDSEEVETNDSNANVASSNIADLD